MDDARVISHINAHQWWRTALPDKRAVESRGVFYASSYREAEFYGRPIDTPFNVKVNKPLFGDEAYIMQALGLPLPSQEISIEERFTLDTKMMSLATKRGHDSIVLVTGKAFQKYLDTVMLPRSIELQVFCSTMVGVS